MFLMFSIFVAKLAGDTFVSRFVLMLIGSAVVQLLLVLMSKMSPTLNSYSGYALYARAFVVGIFALMNPVLGFIVGGLMTITTEMAGLVGTIPVVGIVIKVVNSVINAVLSPLTFLFEGVAAVATHVVTGTGSSDSFFSFRKKVKA